MKISFGIIGYGRFGQLWANELSRFGKVLVYDKNPHVKIIGKNISGSPLNKVAAADVLFLLAPISEIESCCRQISRFLKSNTIVADACSVKIYPVKIMSRLLAKGQPIIGTHPLFGPDSVKRSGGLKSHKIVFCPVKSSKVQRQILLKLFKKMELRVIKATPSEHDRQMAKSQALVHFLGRGLAGLKLHQQMLATPDFQAILKINNMVIHDTWQLFFDIQRYNPYAEIIRKKFIKQLIFLEKSIEHGKH